MTANSIRGVCDVRIRRRFCLCPAQAHHRKCSGNLSAFFCHYGRDHFFDRAWREWRVEGKGLVQAAIYLFRKCHPPVHILAPHVWLNPMAVSPCAWDASARSSPPRHHRQIYTLNLLIATVDPLSAAPFPLRQPMAHTRVAHIESSARKIIFWQKCINRLWMMFPKVCLIVDFIRFADDKWPEMIFPRNGKYVVFAMRAPERIFFTFIYFIFVIFFLSLSRSFIWTGSLSVWISTVNQPANQPPLFASRYDDDSFPFQHHFQST